MSRVAQWLGRVAGRVQARKTRKSPGGARRNALQRKHLARRDDRAGDRRRRAGDVRGTFFVCEHISLDGVIQPGGPNEDSDYSHGGWTAPFRMRPGQRPSPRHRAGLRSAARPPHLRSLGRLLAEGRGRSVRGQSERRDEIRPRPTGRTASDGVRSGTWARTSWRVFAASSHRTALT